MSITTMCLRCVKEPAALGQMCVACTITTQQDMLARFKREEGVYPCSLVFPISPTNKVTITMTSYPTVLELEMVKRVIDLIVPMEKPLDGMVGCGVEQTP